VFEMTDVTATAPRRRVVPRAEREQQMLEAATALFTERGFDRVAMDQIAEAVGITKPMLYSYFDSKEGLYVACIERLAGPVMEAIQGAIRPGDAPESQLWSALRAFFHFVDDNRSQWSAFYVEGSGRGGAAAKRIDQLRGEIAEAVTALLRRTAVEAGISPNLQTEMEVQALAAIGAAETLAKWWIEHPEGADADLLALRLMNFTWMGWGDLLEGDIWLPPPGPDDA
jgi:AcrR family transcriptional regulator